MPQRARCHTVRSVILAERLKSRTKDYLPKCTIPDCGRPTMRAAKQGLAAFHCRYHVQHKARHGSHWRPSYRAADLKPYLATAAAWIKENRTEFYVAAALIRLEASMQSAGPSEIATRLRGRPPAERARVALARLRETGVKPERLLAIHLATAALIEEDPYSHRVREFRVVQVAKTAHRLASGYHRSWDVPLPDGRTGRYDIHAYPRSSGRVLRHLGNMIERECELVADKHLSAVLEQKVSRFGRHPSVVNPAAAVAARHSWNSVHQARAVR